MINMVRLKGVGGQNYQIWGVGLEKRGKKEKKKTKGDGGHGEV